MYSISMEYCNPKKDNDLLRMIDNQQEMIRTFKSINKLNAVIYWELFRVDPVTLLSDDERLPCDVVLIRQSLEKGGRDGSGKIFERFGQLPEGQGMLAKEGRIVDVSFVAAPRQRNTRGQNEQIKEGAYPAGFDRNTEVGRQKDCDARWTKKNNEVHYGGKNHAKADAKTKLVSEYTNTPASVHDWQVFEELINEEYEAVFEDSTYQSGVKCKYLLKKSCRNFILLKAARNDPLSEEELATNKMRIRVRCEHIFGRMSQMGMGRTVCGRSGWSEPSNITRCAI